jgi:hypothetical protein
MNKILLVVLGFVGILALVALSAIVNGWILGILWAWFIIPVFALPALNIPQAIGLGMVVSYITFHYTKDEDTGWSRVVLTLIMRPIVALGIGYIVTLFM